ncbi:MAG: 4Fe-4S binding protein [Clostridia bacterium]|nr:4Fe-4S binding protein [Clostridia bacterium]
MLDNERSSIHDEVNSLNNEQITDTSTEIIDTSADKNEKTEKKQNRFVAWLKRIKPSKRKIIQLYSALLFNANLKGFRSGVIYQGNSKNLCCPGINCYSCPGANTACPLGSLQNAMTSTDKSTIFYILGIILLYGLLAGRWICGWLCPFGLIQELFYKIKTPKLKKNKFTRVLSYFKYVVLVFFVFIIPILYSLRNTPVPAFCKYICPAGTLEGAMGLLSNKVNESSLRMLGPIFTWKFLLMVSIIVGCVFIYRLFCRFLCPLGLLYGFFNKISIFGIKLDKPKCVDCGKCISKCKMDIRHVGDVECISCGECIDVCPTKAISFKNGGISLLDNDISRQPPAVSSQQDLTNNGISDIENKQITDTVSTKKSKMPIEKKRKIFKTVLYSVMALVLVFALVYYNFIHKNPEIPVGSEVGDKCYGMDIPLYDENGLTENTFNVANNGGKITIINFWGTWCGPCVAELPHFDDIASEYADSVTVLAVHSNRLSTTATAYINENYPNSNIIFGKDFPNESGKIVDPEVYYTLLGGANNSYPMTVIVDQNGIIADHYIGSITHEELVSDIEKLLK